MRVRVSPKPDENLIAESYRNRYYQPDQQHDQLVAAICEFAAAACLAETEQ